MQIFLTGVSLLFPHIRNSIFAADVAANFAANPPAPPTNNQDDEDFVPNDEDFEPEDEIPMGTQQQPSAAKAANTTKTNAQVVAKPQAHRILHHTPTKSLTQLVDGRILASWKLETEWDGEIYLNEACDKIMMDSYYPKSKYFCAQKLLSGSGVNDRNHVFQNNMQVEREETYKKYLANNPTDTSRGIAAIGCIVVTEVVFQLAEPVKNQYFNFNGGEEDAVPIDLYETGEWAMVVLEKKKEEPKKMRPKIRRRGRRENAGAGSNRPRPSDDDTLTEAERALRAAALRSQNNANVCGSGNAGDRAVPVDGTDNDVNMVQE